MIEVIIKITGNTLLNDKVDELIKAARKIQETEENLDTKMEIKKKKEKIKKAKQQEEKIVEYFEKIEDDVTEDEEIKDIEDIEVDEEDEEDEDDENSFSIEELRKDTKGLFIKLTKKDKPKAKALLEKYNVSSFSELEEAFEDSTTKWQKLIKTLKKYVG